MEEFKESCGYYGLLGRDGGWEWGGGTWILGERLEDGCSIL